MQFSTTITKVIESRHSKRDYRNEPLSKELIKNIQSIFSENRKGPFGNLIDFRLIEKSNAKTNHKVKLQRIDMGIAMLHFEITCKELNLNGIWQVQQPDIASEQEQYLVSWLPKAQ
jgi:nitroreductase